jgi:hypothetical protein
MMLSLPGAGEEVKLTREEHPKAKPTSPAVQLAPLALPGFQKENLTCRSTRRFSVAEPKNPPVSAIDWPKRDAFTSPTGAARFWRLSRFRAEMLKVRL